MSKRIEVLLADHHTLARVGMRVFLTTEGDFVVSGEAATRREVTTLCSTLQPDVLLLDFSLVQGRAINESLADLRRTCSTMQVLLLLSGLEKISIFELLASGVVGGVLKKEAPQTIALAIRSAMCGGTWFSRALLTELAKAPAKPANLPTAKPLTKRENQVLQLLTQGMGNQQIASKLQVTQRTVEFHLGNIFRKLGVASRLEAVLWAKDMMIYG